MDKFHLGWFMGNGYGVQGWGEPGYGHGYDWKKPDLYIDMLRTLERGGFDLFIIEDTVDTPDVYKGNMETALKYHMRVPKHDPLPLVPLLAQATKHIGIIPTLSTTFYPPFLLARLMATLDHLTDGRVGWNIVTTTSHMAAKNFGLDGLPPHDTRYDIADEYVELCCQLWDTWAPDAVVMDEENHIFADHTKVHRVDFEGDYFRSRGPLNTVAMPQGRPVFVQAGGSPRGRAFAAKHAEVVIASGQGVQHMKDYYAEVKVQMETFGRDKNSCKVLFTCQPVIVDSPEHAVAMKKRAAEHFDATIDEQIDRMLASMSTLTGTDFSQFPLDEPLPDFEHDGNRSTLAHYYQEDPVPTIRQIVERRRDAGGGMGTAMVGTPEQIADQMESTMDEVGGDGYLFSGPMRPKHIVGIVDELVPVLQRRGLTRTSYNFDTFRDNLFEY